MGFNEKIEKIHELATSLWYELATEKTKQGGHPGVLGPSSEDEEWTSFYGYLMGTIKTLNDISNFYPNKEIAVISLNIEDFKQWMSERGLVGNMINTPRRIKCGNVIYHCISNSIHPRSYSFDEIIETDYAKENKEYDLIITVIRPNLRPQK